MKFYIAHEPMTSGLIQYNQSELSFDTVGNEERLFTIVLGELYVGLDVSTDCETVCAMSGLSSPALWKPSKIEFPDAQDGKLRVNIPEAVPGCGYSYPGDWYVRCDREAGKILIAPKTYETDCGDDCQYVRFLGNAIAALRGSELIALSIKDMVF